MFDMTKHAAAVIAARAIRREWINSVVTSPTLVHPDLVDEELEHRLAVVTEKGNRVLRVIIKRGTMPPRVITAYFDRQMKGKL